MKRTVNEKYYVPVMRATKVITVPDGGFFLFLINIYLLIYLAVSGLRCGTWNFSSDM